MHSGESAPTVQAYRATHLRLSVGRGLPLEVMSATTHGRCPERRFRPHSCYGPPPWMRTSSPSPRRVTGTATSVAARGPFLPRTLRHPESPVTGRRTCRSRNSPDARWRTFSAGSLAALGELTARRARRSPQLLSCRNCGKIPRAPEPRSPGFGILQRGAGTAAGLETPAQVANSSCTGTDRVRCPRRSPSQHGAGLGVRQVQRTGPLGWHTATN